MKYFLLLIAFTIVSVVHAQTGKTISVLCSSTGEINPDKAELLITYKYQERLKNGDVSLAPENLLHKVLDQFGISRASLALDNVGGSSIATGYYPGSYFMTTKTFRLKVQMPVAIENLIPSITQTGAVSVNIVYLESSLIDSLRRTVSRSALEEGKARAMAIAAMMGGQLGTVLSVEQTVPESYIFVQEPGTDSVSAQFMRTPGTISSACELETMTVGKIKIRQTYEIRFELK